MPSADRLGQPLDCPDTERRPVGQVELAQHGPGAERRLADDLGPRRVLERAGRSPPSSRCCHRPPPRAAGRSPRHPARRGARSAHRIVALDVDEAFRRELAGDADGLVDVPARVAAQVEDDPGGARGPGRLQRLDDVIRRAIRGTGSGGSGLSSCPAPSSRRPEWIGTSARTIEIVRSAAPVPGRIVSSTFVPASPRTSRRPRRSTDLPVDRPSTATMTSPRCRCRPPRQDRHRRHR